jgi:hypothetical protein
MTIDDELLDAARRVVGDANTRFHEFAHPDSEHPSDASLGAFERAIREVASGLNEWLRAYDSSGDVDYEEHLEETREREHDRQQPET